MYDCTHHSGTVAERLQSAVTEHVNIQLRKKQLHLGDICVCNCHDDHRNVPQSGYPQSVPCPMCAGVHASHGQTLLDTIHHNYQPCCALVMPYHYLHHISSSMHIGAKHLVLPGDIDRMSEVCNTFPELLTTPKAFITLLKAGYTNTLLTKRETPIVGLIMLARHTLIGIDPLMKKKLVGRSVGPAKVAQATERMTHLRDQDPHYLRYVTPTGAILWQNKAFMYHPPGMSMSMAWWGEENY